MDVGYRQIPCSVHLHSLARSLSALTGRYGICAGLREGGALGDPMESLWGCGSHHPRRTEHSPLNAGPFPGDPEVEGCPAPALSPWEASRQHSFPQLRLCCLPAALRKSLQILKTELKHWFYRKNINVNCTTWLCSPPREPPYSSGSLDGVSLSPVCSPRLHPVPGHVLWCSVSAEEHPRDPDSIPSS